MGEGHHLLQHYPNLTKKLNSFKTFSNDSSKRTLKVENSNLNVTGIGNVVY
ncbi:hypothetical protein Hanom_Chr15g01373971 [Helianthus anomalus]